MGSDSDWPVVKGACQQLETFGIPYEAHILSAHRTPVEAAEFARSARANGFGAIIAAAGMAAHLAGAIAAGTTLPVIGIPIKSAQLGGMDALLSTVQMPSGIPVATVAINGGTVVFAGAYAFYNQKVLTTLTMGEGSQVTDIGKYAFGATSATKLANLTLGPNLKNIHPYAFARIAATTITIIRSSYYRAYCFRRNFYPYKQNQNRNKKNNKGNKYRI